MSARAVTLDAAFAEQRTTAASDLAALQAALQAHILDPSRPVPGAVCDTPRVDSRRRVAIYVQAYRLRLVEALAQDYPALHALLGEAEFSAMAGAYAVEYPSRHFSIRWFGARLGKFLARTPPYREQPMLEQLARFEWALGEAFDAADAPVAGPDELARLPVEEWGELRLVEHPSVRYLMLGRHVPLVWRTLTEGLCSSSAEDPGSVATWRVWRRELRTFFRSIDAIEALAARSLTDHTFGALCERLCSEMPEAAVPDYAATLLRTWIAEGTFTRLAVGAAKVPATSGKRGI